MLQEQISRFEKKQAVVGIIGLGYVGLPLAMQFTQAGFQTVGLDVDSAKIEKLRAGKSYIGHIPDEKITELIQGKMFVPTADYSEIQRLDAVSICVPTPLDEHMQPDLSYVKGTAEQIAPHIKRGQLIILESTTYPGTTEEIVLPILQAGGKKAGKDFYLVFSPEREDPGNKQYTTKTIPKVIGGLTSEGLEVAKSFYGQVFSNLVSVSNTQVAETTKLLENIFRSVNIALVNELKMLCDRMDIDIWEVIEAASTKPFGFMPFYPGPGLGGHCIPIDPFYLSWKAHEFDFHTRFIELAGDVNTSMPYYVVQKTLDALNQKGIAGKQAKVLVLGVAYKRDVDDCRESPALKVVSLLWKHLVEVCYNDPYVPEYPVVRKGNLGLSSVPLTDELLQSVDAVLILTDHSCFDYERIVEKAQLVIDTRNATRNVKTDREKIVKA